ncbi:hypothetical protein ACFSPA_06785 [Paracidovorax citrulli]|uniref:hypothetical protein n=1 Tax=Paracidovorax citrulli TaxID=80869 RepID=UPI00088F4006|nr:hypothetical protein APS58_0164 [Paracidovorax citrulli]SDK58826.1 hypothetical protein SAMN04489709_1191 [Paracidovorax citrulli]
MGYDARKPPNQECPECFGAGQSRTVLKDTRQMSPGAPTMGSWRTPVPERRSRVPDACQVGTLVAPILIGGLPGFLAGVAALVGLAVSLCRHDRVQEAQMRKRMETIVTKAGEAAQLAAAGEIARIKPRNITIRQELDREIQTRVEYRDCRHGPDGLRLINEALTGRAEPLVMVSCPETRPAVR